MSPHKNTLVFLPGWGFKATVFKNIASRFSKQNIIFLDLPQTSAQDLNEISNLIAKDFYGECTLIAWSMSSLIAATLCLNFPKKFTRLITVCGTPKFIADEFWPGVEYKTAKAFKRQAKTDLQSLLFNFQSEIGIKNLTHTLEAEHKLPLLFYLDLLINSDLRETYSQLKIPVLHIFGDKDAIITPAIAHEIKQTFPHKNQIISGAGHVPFLTHAHEFYHCINSFLMS